MNWHRGLVEMDVLHLVKKKYCLLIVHRFGSCYLYDEKYNHTAYVLTDSEQGKNLETCHVL